MNRKIILLLSLAAAFVFAQSVEGTITDKENKPAVETEVLITKDNTKELQEMFIFPLPTNLEITT